MLTAEVSAPHNTACALTQSFSSIFVVVFKQLVLEKEIGLRKKSTDFQSPSLFLLMASSIFSGLCEWLVLILHKFSIISFLFSCFTDSLEEYAGKS